MTAQIDDLHRNLSAKEELSNKLADLVKDKQNVKLKIENNQNKAKKMRRFLSKDFLIRNNVKEEFDLF